MKTKGDLNIYQTSGELFEAAARFILSLAKKAVADKRQFSIALSGGNTPGLLYRLLASPPFLDEMPWSKTFIFWGDERCVPLDDKRNNAREARSILLDKVPVPAQNIHVIPVNLSPKDAAVAYERELKEFFGSVAPVFDLILLGLGENGHTASIFPGTPQVDERAIGVREVFVKEQDMFRITMTAPLINLARNILFLVTGKEKADILQSVLNAPYQPANFPAQLIQPSGGDLFWFADQYAASKLK